MKCRATQSLFYIDIFGMCSSAQDDWLLNSNNTLQMHIKIQHRQHQNIENNTYYFTFMPTSQQPRKIQKKC